MANKTYHVVRANDGHWAVKKVGAKASLHSTQDAAIKAATRLAKDQSEAQVVVFKPNGQFVVKEVRGLPTVQTPPKKSSLGTVRISKAISTALKKRLEIT